MSINRFGFLKLAVAGALASGALFFAASANAGTNWSVGINVPGFIAEPAAPVYYEPPPPVYYQPAPPVYYRPPPVYYRAPPVYYRPAPVYYGAPQYYGEGEHWRHHHRRDDDDRD